MNRVLLQSHGRIPSHSACDARWPSARHFCWLPSLYCWSSPSPWLRVSLSLRFQPLSGFSLQPLPLLAPCTTISCRSGEDHEPPRSQLLHPLRPVRRLHYSERESREEAVLLVSGGRGWGDLAHISNIRAGLWSRRMTRPATRWFCGERGQYCAGHITRDGCARCSGVAS